MFPPNGYKRACLEGGPQSFELYCETIESDTCVVLDTRQIHINLRYREVHNKLLYFRAMTKTPDESEWETLILSIKMVEYIKNMQSSVLSSRLNFQISIYLTRAKLFGFNINSANYRQVEYICVVAIVYIDAFSNP